MHAVATSKETKDAYGILVQSVGTQQVKSLEEDMIRERMSQILTMYNLRPVLLSDLPLASVVSFVCADLICPVCLKEGTCSFLILT